MIVEHLIQVRVGSVSVLCNEKTTTAYYCSFKRNSPNTNRKGPLCLACTYIYINVHLTDIIGLPTIQVKLYFKT